MQETIEADLTVTKLDHDRYWVVATDTAHRHVETRMRRHFSDQHAIVTDVTSGYAQLNVQGPLSREVLEAATRESFADLRYFRRRPAKVGRVAIDVSREVDSYLEDHVADQW